MEKTAKWTYWVALLMGAMLCLVVSLGLMPTEAHAATNTKLAAGTVSKIYTPNKTTTTANPYVDVNSKTVDKVGIAAVRYVKFHKGFTNIINGTRFYPLKSFTQAQFTKILRNLYGAKVALSKAKTAVTGKYACDTLTKVAKQVFGVSIKWKSGASKTVLTRTGCANYIKTFAQWNNSLFKPKQ